MKKTSKHSCQAFIERKGFVEDFFEPCARPAKYKVTGFSKWKDGYYCGVHAKVFQILLKHHQALNDGVQFKVEEIVDE